MRLIQRIDTERGPRTSVISNLDSEHAYLLLSAIQANGGEGHVAEDGPTVNLREYMRHHRTIRKVIALRRTG